MSDQARTSAESALEVALAAVAIGHCNINYLKLSEMLGCAEHAARMRVTRYHQKFLPDMERPKSKGGRVLKVKAIEAGDSKKHELEGDDHDAKPKKRKYVKKAVKAEPINDSTPELKQERRVF